MGSTGKSQEERFIEDMVRDITSSIPVDESGLSADTLMSNGDIQGIVEAFTMRYGGDDDEILDKIRDRVNKLIRK